jgi:outer membrane protein assembly factor BamB
MGQLIRRFALLVAILALALGTASCGGSSDDADAKAGSKAGKDAEIPKVVKIQRWPRYWATRDRAEEGASDSMGTEYFAGYDDTSVVYTGQDVIRFLDLKTGKQRRQVVLKNNRLICTSQPRRQIENGIVLVATGVEGVDDCQRVEAYDAATGALKWTYGQVGQGGELTIAQRDGIVLVAMNAGAGQESAGLMAALDADTGKPLWQHQVPDYFFGRAARKKDECFLNPALAADRAVVITFMGCNNVDDQNSALYGIDLKTGEKLWKTDFWEKPEYFYITDAKDVRPHVDDGRTVPASENNRAVRVDSKSGMVTVVPEPQLPKVFKRVDPWPPCDDFRAIDIGIPTQHGNQCLFTNGDTEIFAQDLSFKNKLRMQIQAVDADTGKRLWVWDERQLHKPKDYTFRDYQFLGFNHDRTEFWVGRNAKDVIRLDMKSGRRVGQGLAAPPLNLAQLTLPGPKFMLVRTSGGITNPDGSNVGSGLNFYATDAD